MLPAIFARMAAITRDRSTSGRLLQHSTRTDVARNVDDAPRLLAVRSELGYTDRPDRALTDEPEAVSSAYQRYLTREVERRRIDCERAAWLDARDTIRLKLSALTGTTFDTSRNDLRALLRLVERIDRRLAA